MIHKYIFTDNKTLAVCTQWSCFLHIYCISLERTHVNTMYGAVLHYNNGGTHSNKTCTFVVCIYEPKSNAFPFPSIYKGNTYYDSLRNKCKKSKGFFFLFLSASHSLINLCKSIEFEIHIFLPWQGHNNRLSQHVESYFDPYFFLGIYTKRVCRYSVFVCWIKTI